MKLGQQTAMGKTVYTTSVFIINKPHATTIGTSWDKSTLQFVWFVRWDSAVMRFGMKVLAGGRGHHCLSVSFENSIPALVFLFIIMIEWSNKTDSFNNGSLFRAENLLLPLNHSNARNGLYLIYAFTLLHQPTPTLHCIHLRERPCRVLFIHQWTFFTCCLSLIITHTIYTAGVFKLYHDTCS